MLNVLLHLQLSKIPISFKVFSKLVLGGVLLLLILPYQPSLAISPYKESKAYAQEGKSQAITINSQTLGFAFQLPHPGYLSTPYSSFHPGIDLAAGLGIPIKPIAKGNVVQAGYNFWGLGLMVIVDHGHGYKSLYAHMGKTYVTTGQEVGENSFIGEVGLTGHTSGPHTHLELYKDAQTIDPLTLLPEIRIKPIESDFLSNKPATQTNQGGKITPPAVLKLDFKKQLLESL